MNVESYLTVLLVPIVHEVGHFIVAKIFGQTLKFRFEWGKLGPIPIPRWTWKHPDVKEWQLKIICIAGFGLELALVPFMPLSYQVAAIAHFIIYPMYSGNNSDWSVFKKKK